MTKNEIIADIASNTGVSRSDVESVINDFTGLISDELAGGGSVSWPDFGKFSSVDKPAREGRNPHSGETIQIAAKRVAKFKPAAGLARRVNGE